MAEQLFIHLSGGTGRGICLHGGGAGPLLVNQVDTSSPSHILVFPGDQIVSVNGININGKTAEEIQREIDSPGNDLVLEIIRKSQAGNKAMETTKTVVKEESSSSETFTKVITQTCVTSDNDSQIQSDIKSMESSSFESSVQVNPTDPNTLGSTSDHSPPQLAQSEDKPPQDTEPSQVEGVVPVEIDSHVTLEQEPMLVHEEPSQDTAKDPVFVDTPPESACVQQEVKTDSAPIESAVIQEVMETTSVDSMSASQQVESVVKETVSTADHHAKPIMQEEIKEQLEEIISEIDQEVTREMAPLSHDLRDDSQQPMDSDQVGDKQIPLDRLFTPAEDADLIPKHRGKMFSSSSFYADPNNMYPTMEEQLELAKKISHSLSDNSNKESKGQSMYVKRKKRSVQWVHGAPDEYISNSEMTLETEDNLSGQPQSMETCSKESEVHLREKPELKLVLNPGGQLLDAQKLRNSGAYVDHGMMSPEVCLDLVRDLNSPSGKGAALFAKRKKKSEQWVVDDSNVKKLNVTPEPFSGMSQTSTTHTSFDRTKWQAEQQQKLKELQDRLAAPKVRLIQSPWDAALTTGSVDAAFEQVQSRNVTASEVVDTVIRTAETKDHFSHTISGNAPLGHTAVAPSGHSFVPASPLNVPPPIKIPEMPKFSNDIPQPAQWLKDATAHLHGAGKHLYPGNSNIFSPQPFDAVKLRTPSPVRFSSSPKCPSTLSRPLSQQPSSICDNYSKTESSTMKYESYSEQSSSIQEIKTITSSGFTPSAVPPTPQIAQTSHPAPSTPHPSAPSHATLPKHASSKPEHGKGHPQGYDSLPRSFAPKVAAHSLPISFTPMPTTAPKSKPVGKPVQIHPQPIHYTPVVYSHSSKPVGRPVILPSSMQKHSANSFYSNQSSSQTSAQRPDKSHVPQEHEGKTPVSGTGGIHYIATVTSFGGTAASSSTKESIQHQYESQRRLEETRIQQQLLQEEHERKRILEEQKRLKQLEEQQRLKQLEEQQRLKQLEEQKRLKQLEEQQRLKQSEEQQRLKQLEEQQRLRQLEEQQRLKQLEEQQRLKRLEEERLFKLEEAHRLERERQDEAAEMLSRAAACQTRKTGHCGRPASVGDFSCYNVSPRGWGEIEDYYRTVKLYHSFRG